jgi:hypothetical protein
MKLKALVSMCLRENCFILMDRVNSEGEVIGQWLGTLDASYPLSGQPYLTEEHLISLFDITEKQREKLHFRHEQLPDSTVFSDTDEDEEWIDREQCTLGYAGYILRPLFTRDGIVFLDEEAFRPLSDIADMMELYERRDADGSTVIAVKTGLLIAGIIMPVNIVSDDFVELMDSMALKSRAVLENRQSSYDDAQIEVEYDNYDPLIVPEWIAERHTPQEGSILPEDEAS